MEFIAELCFDGLQPGVLAQIFKGGALAVVIFGRERVGQLWSHLLQNPAECLPWRGTLADMARNHQGSLAISEELGDGFHFKPGRHAFVFRKMELARNGADEGPVHCEPADFHQGSGRFASPRETLDLCWDAGRRIMSALHPLEKPVMMPFRVAVQRLQYQSCVADNERLFRLVEHSLGNWAGLGFQIDRRRESARGFLAPRGVCDAFALMGMVPGISHMIAALNRHAASRSPDDQVRDGGMIIGKAHCDTRYFSAMCGTRRDIRTEICANGHWIELPIGLDSLVVLPGTLAERDLGIPATRHRVVQAADRNDSPSDDLEDRNVTLLLGAK